MNEKFYEQYKDIPADKFKKRETTGKLADKKLATKPIGSFKDAMILSLIAAPITALLSMMIAYLVVKKKFIGKGAMEFVTMFSDRNSPLTIRWASASVIW